MGDEGDPVTSAWPDACRFAYPWTPDAGDGTYRNPVIHADYSDPDVIRHGDDFYMVASSFNCTPGLPILHSRDLVNWQLIGHALDRLPHPRYQEVQPGCGAWAPSIRYHLGRFWVFFPMPDEGIYWTTARQPAGPWTQPHLLRAARGWIDPCPFWDDDGQAYLAHAYANSRAGIRDKIHIRPMAPDGSALLGDGKVVIDAPHHPYLEGPKVHKIDGWYYILAPGGGVPTGWQVAFRSRDIYGPYEEKVVLERGLTPINGPHQGALVDTPGGEWWFMHFQDAGAFGRIVHLQPVKWRDGWPMMGIDHDGNGVGEPVALWRKPAVCPAAGAGESPGVVVPQTSDEFDCEKLGLQWQWQANYARSWYSLAARRGWLRLYGQAAPSCDLGRTPNLLLQKFPARRFSVQTLMEFSGRWGGDRAGLAVIGGGVCASLAVHASPAGRCCTLQIDNKTVWETPVAAQPIRLQATVDERAKCVFAYAIGNDGPFTTIDREFFAKEGGWMGAKLGLYCMTPREDSAAAGYADFDYFRFASA